MARVRISEFQAKSVLKTELGLPWQGLSVNKNISSEALTAFFGPTRLIVKIDQGIKQRKKQNLVFVSDRPKAILKFIHQKSQLGYSQFLIEPFIDHSLKQEQYLSLERIREGIKILYSPYGGIEIENHWQTVKNSVNNKKIQKLVNQLQKIFNRYHFSFMEINPLLVRDNQIYPLDLAVEIDDTALNLNTLANFQLEPVSVFKMSPSELKIKRLDSQTPASLKYRLLNKDGVFWMLLSGGGASLVLADEVADLGYGQDLANYGEYSGSPTLEDTYLYTKVLLTDLLQSKAKQKVLIIAGGVANFTDVATTFQGVIKALNEFKKPLRQQKVKVFVRRGGPNQKKGLALMTAFLKEAQLFGAVLGSDQPLTKVISLASDHLKKNND